MGSPRLTALVTGREEDLKVSTHTMSALREAALGRAGGLGPGLDLEPAQRRHAALFPAVRLARTTTSASAPHAVAEGRNVPGVWVFFRQ